MSIKMISHYRLLGATLFLSVIIHTNAQDGIDVGNATDLAASGHDELGDAAKFFAGPVEVVATHDEFAWLESPVWNEAGNYLLFSDVKWQNEGGDACGMIWKWDESTSSLSKFLPCSGTFGPGEAPDDLSDYIEAGSNGLYWGWKGASNGDLLICQHGKHRIVRINVNDVSEFGGIDPSLVTVIADSYDGKPLNSPNDLHIHKGDLYFTDPPFGRQKRSADDPFGQAFADSPQDPAVYKILGGDPGSEGAPGNPERLIFIPRTPDLRHAFNGITLVDEGEDSGYMFLGVTNFEDPHFRSYSYPWDMVASLGEYTRAESEYRIRNNTEDLPPLIDGVTYSPGLDVIFGAGPGGVYIFGAGLSESSTYELIGFIRIDDLVANIVVGGGYLWMTANKRLLRIPLTEEAAAATVGEGQQEDPKIDDDKPSSAINAFRRVGYNGAMTAGVVVGILLML